MNINVRGIGICLYDVASCYATNKVYADGKGPRYDYTPDAKLGLWRDANPVPPWEFRKNCKGKSKPRL